MSINSFSYLNAFLYLKSWRGVISLLLIFSLPVIWNFFSERILFGRSYSSDVSLLCRPATSPNFFFCNPSGDNGSLYMSNSLKNSFFGSSKVLLDCASFNWKTLSPLSVCLSPTILVSPNPSLSDFQISDSFLFSILLSNTDFDVSSKNSGEASLYFRSDFINGSPFIALLPNLIDILAPRIPSIIPLA